MKITMPCTNSSCPDGTVEFSSIVLGDADTTLVGSCETCLATFTLSGGQVRLVSDHDRGSIEAVPLEEGRPERFVRTIGRARPRV